jgi:heme/copper-type cytochrome/quinol oxidase subunit 2
MKYFRSINDTPSNIPPLTSFAGIGVYSSSLFTFFYAPLLDSPREWQCTFQDPATSTMEGIIDFHHDVTCYLVGILIFVLYILLAVVIQYRSDSKCAGFSLNVYHDAPLEVWWTLLPVLILFSIATPSFALMFAIDEVIDPLITLKAVGHQWY